MSITHRILGCTAFYVTNIHDDAWAGYGFHTLARLQRPLCIDRLIRFRIHYILRIDRTQKIYCTRNDERRRPFPKGRRVTSR